MFKLATTEVYTWPVKFNTPADGGRLETHTFDAQFKRLPATRIKEISESGNRGETNDPQVVREIMVGWAGVTDAAGQEIPFSEATLNDVLEVHGVATAIVLAWMESLSGARRKN